MADRGTDTAPPGPAGPEPGAPGPAAGAATPAAGSEEAAADPRTPPSRRQAVSAASGSSTRKGGSSGTAFRRTADRWRVAFVALAVFAVMAGVGWPLLDTKVLVVRSVVVTGASPLVPAKRVRAVAAVRPGVPLTRVDTRAVASRVASITRVGTARVTRGWPDRIEISIRVRTPVLAVALPGPTASASTAGGFDLIDASGVVLRQVSRKPHGMPTLQAPGQPAGADFVATLHGSTAVAAAAAVLRALPARLASTVVTVTAQSADAVTLTLSDGATVVWGGPGRSAAKARELAVLLRGGAHYVDVSAPGTVVSR